MTNQPPPVNPGYPPKQSQQPMPQPRRSRLPWAVAFGVLFAVVGILGYRLMADDAPAQDGPTAGEPSVRLVEPAAASESPTPDPAAPAKPLKLGQAHSFTADGDKVAVTALAHKRYSDLDTAYEGVQVRTCNKGTDTFSVSTLPWMLSYSGGEELSQDTVVGGGLAAPEFTDRDLAPGKCAKGWISWVPAKSGKPDGVEYHIDGYPNASTRWEW